MINILVVGNQYQRIKDQILLCKKLLKIGNKFRFMFLLNTPNLIPFFNNESELSYSYIGKKKKLSEKPSEEKTSNFIKKQEKY